MSSLKKQYKADLAKIENEILEIEDKINEIEFTLYVYDNKEDELSQLYDELEDLQKLAEIVKFDIKTC